MRFVLAAAAMLLLLVFGCAGEKVVQQNASAGAPKCTDYSLETCPPACVVCPPCAVCSSISCQTEEFCKGIGFNRSWWNAVDPGKAKPVQNALPVQDGKGGAGAVGQTEMEFVAWNAPDGSIALQMPTGWKAGEKQVDKCSVSWAVLDPAGTSSAYMDNEIMVLKSESARQMYKSYGLAGIDSTPVANYLGAEQAVQQIIAPLTGASSVHVTYADAATSAQFSQAVCATGLAACDARVFEAAYEKNGALMRGKYFVQTYDFGEGTTWWINIWGYTSPAADWEQSAPVLEKIFASEKYTDEWAAKCQNSAAASDAIGEVIKSRQAASDSAAAAWDEYIRGG